MDDEEWGEQSTGERGEQREPCSAVCIHDSTMTMVSMMNRPSNTVRYRGEIGGSEWNNIGCRISRERIFVCFERRKQAVPSFII